MLKISEDLARIPRGLDCLDLILSPSLQKEIYIQKKLTCQNLKTNAWALLQTNSVRICEVEPQASSFLNVSQEIGVCSLRTTADPLAPTTLPRDYSIISTTSNEIQNRMNLPKHCFNRSFILERKKRRGDRRKEGRKCMFVS